jgi:hypothetical protein
MRAPECMCIWTWSCRAVQVAPPSPESPPPRTLSSALPSRLKHGLHAHGARRLDRPRRGRPPGRTRGRGRGDAAFRDPTLGPPLSYGEGAIGGPSRSCHAIAGRRLAFDVQRRDCVLAIIRPYGLSRPGNSSFCWLTRRRGGRIPDVAGGAWKAPGAGAGQGKGARKRTGTRRTL